ncbi:MAG: response regulator [Desulfobacterales bacterium]|nr:response regulator [Desulfobacterales bacterium]
MPRILVVDDEESIRFSFRKILSRAGYDVIAASHIIDAKAILPANEFDVAIVDRLLECHDGVELIKHIRTVQPWCETILMSAYPTFKSASETLELEAVAYLTKPVKKEELHRAVEAAVMKAESKREADRRERVFQSLFDALPNAVVVCDPDRRVRFINKAFTRIFGYTREELMGGPTPGAPEWDKGESDAEIDDLLEGKTAPERETGMLTKEGRLIDVAVTRALSHDAHGAPADILTIIRDISKQKKLEARLRYKEKLDSMGTLAGGVAHDFNNIITSIVGFTDLARQDLEKDSPPYVNLNEALGACDLARELVQQIFMFSRRGEQELKPVAMGALVEETLKLMRAYLPSAVDIRLRIKGDSMVMADPARINQVIMNLCANAGQAMGENGGVLEVALDVATPDPGETAAHPDVRAGEYARLTVADNGRGMPSRVMNRIFDPFFTTRERETGTGLGLAMVHGIVARFGGFVTVESEEGAGSTFRVHLPVKKEVAPSGIAPRSPFPGGAERILFIDDERPIINFANRFLKRLGYHVEIRSSGVEALALFKAGHDRFDIIVTDMIMPDMPGDELTREFQRIRPDVPIILCTGLGQMEAEKKAKAMGVSAFVTKPILMGEMAETIRGVLDARTPGSRVEKQVV